MGLVVPSSVRFPRHCVCRAADMLDTRAAKSNGGVFLYSEEGVGTQVGITQYVMRIDASSVDFSLHPGIGRGLLVDMKLTAQSVEASSRRRNRHDANSKRHP